MTQFVGKWTCYDSTELRGMVHSVSGGTIDVVPDAPYGSLLPGSPASGLVHLELYSTPCATNPEFIGTGEGPTPKVLDGGQQRDVRVGDHIRVVGAWCMENQHLDFEFLRGLFKAGFVFTEFHPYFPSTAQLLPNPQPGDPVDLTLTTRAPAYNQAYTLTWWWNRFGKVTATGDVAVVDESIRNPVTTDWSLDPPLLPDGGSPLTHSLVLRTIEEGRESLTQRVIVPASGNAIRFTVTLAGSDVAHASRFKATCRLRWVPRSAVRALYVPNTPIGLVALLFTSESILLARLGGYANSARNAIEQAVHHGWALGQPTSTVIADLGEKIELQALHQAPISTDQAWRFFADTAVRFARYGVPFGVQPDGEPTPNSVDWTDHRAWAGSVASSIGASLAVLALTSELILRMQSLMGYLSKNPECFPQMLFTWESTELALEGGYLNPARNNPDPSVHFAWAATQPCEIMRDDLMEKYDLQFDHLSAQITGAALAAKFYAETSVRLNSWGADFGSQAENSLDGSVQETWARAATLADLKRETERRVRILFESSYL